MSRTTDSYHAERLRAWAEVPLIEARAILDYDLFAAADEIDLLRAGIAEAVERLDAMAYLVKTVSTDLASLLEREEG